MGNRGAIQTLQSSSCDIDSNHPFANLCMLVNLNQKSEAQVTSDTHSNHEIGITP